MTELHYIPINCTFHDRLEDLAVRRKVVHIVYLEDEHRREAESIILDVYARDEADYVELAVRGAADSVVIRLDRLVVVDGHEMPQAY